MEEIIKTYENHPSFILIKDNVLSEDKESSTMEPDTVVEINKIVKNLNPKKANGPDEIVKLAANTIEILLANIIHNDFKKNSFFLTLMKWLL